MKVYKNNKGQYHRDNGPALDWGDNDYVWFHNGIKHRYYGPADTSDEPYLDTVAYFIFGERIK